MDTSNKWYSCLWIQPTYDFNQSVENNKFFSSENGYDEEDINKIDLLEPGDTLKLDTDHIIVRIN